MPRYPRQPDENTGDKRRESFLQLWQQESAPPGLLEHRCEGEIVDEADGAKGRERRHRRAARRLNHRQVKVGCNRGRGEQQ